LISIFSMQLLPANNLIPRFTKGFLNHTRYLRRRLQVTSTHLVKPTVTACIAQLRSIPNTNATTESSELIAACTGVSGRK
jgi:hypothetical protein